MWAKAKKARKNFACKILGTTGCRRPQTPSATLAKI